MKKRLRNCVIITLAIVICCGTTALLESKFARDNTVETYSVSQFDSITEYVDSIKGKKVSPFSRASTSELYVANEELISSTMGVDFEYVEVSGQHSYFKFKVTEPNNLSSLQNNIANDISGYSASGEQLIDEDTARTCTEQFIVGCGNEDDGEDILNSLAEMAPLMYWESHPGYYYTTSPYMDMADPLGYMIYWVKDGTFFQAAVPADRLDEFWQISDSLMVQTN